VSDGVRSDPHYLGHRARLDAEVLERGDGPLADALMAAEITVVVITPRQVSRRPVSVST